MASPQKDGEAQEGTTAVAAPHSDLPKIVPSLPLETRCPPFQLRQYGGFWLPEVTLKVGLPAMHGSFEPRPTDIFLSSFPKSGTTWLKALSFATLNRMTYSPFDNNHPLCSHNPHDYVGFLEVEFSHVNDIDNLREEFEAPPSPRIFSTHLPYSLLPYRFKEASRIVYICRDPKDSLVSTWFFTKKAAPSVGVDAQSYKFLEAFELFCDGRSVFGPHWQHALQYWEESVKSPKNVLFLRYEEMLLDPKSSLKKLAKFMGCEFTQEEDEKGVVDAIVELCCLDKLKEVNKDGNTKLNVPKESYFRKGVAGDWRNHMTPEMAHKLDKIVEDALQGSGLTFSR
jgi:hydroxyjasmonate sulfotransferase